MTTPIDAFRQGDFSSLAATNPIFDPTTGNPDGSGRTQFRDASRATSANPLGLNIIPQNRINSAATNLLGLLPQPNIAGATDNNYTLSGQGLYNGNQYNGRMDWNISDKSRLMGRYTYFATDIDTPSVFGTVAGGPPLGGLVNAGVSTSLAQNVAVTYNHDVFSKPISYRALWFQPLEINRFRCGQRLANHLSGRYPWRQWRREPRLYQRSFYNGNYRACRSVQYGRGCRTLYSERDRF